LFDIEQADNCKNDLGQYLFNGTDGVIKPGGTEF
jgi:hypothetical protein